MRSSTLQDHPGSPNPHGHMGSPNPHGHMGSPKPHGHMGSPKPQKTTSIKVERPRTPPRTPTSTMVTPSQAVTPSVSVIKL